MRGGIDTFVNTPLHVCWELSNTSIYFLVSQKIVLICSISDRSRSATATSLVFLASPALLVADQNRSWSCG